MRILSGFLVGAASVLLTLASVGAPARAAGPGTPLHGIGLLDQIGDVREQLESDGWLVHGQFTFIDQGHFGFRSPYAGANSLTDGTRFRETTSLGPVIGRKLWDGAAVYANPEWDQGFGLNSSTGVAGFPNNEAFRVGKTDPTLTVPRFFLRQVIGLGGPTETLEPDQLQFGETVDVERVTLTVGKMSVWDIFDDNRYAHDARTQFMNWALVGNGAIDFAADARGYTPGIAVEYNNAAWAARAGVFQVSKNVNSKPLDDHVLDAYQVLVELEQRFSIGGRPGRLRELGMVDRTRAINYGRYTGLAPIDGTDPLPAFRRYRENFGFGLNLEQELADELGMFARVGWNPGRVQEFMFTEIDRHASIGLSLTGGRWGRPNDTVGLAGMINALSDHHRAFYEAGNLGFILGDGRLRYAPEEIVETYYDLAIVKGAALALDYQFVNHPGYNADRGPVSILSVRLHLEF